MTGVPIYLEIPVAEFERLHTSLRERTGERDRMVDRVAELLTEVERLLIDNAELSSNVDEYQSQLEDALGEIGTLRARLATYEG